MNLARQTFGREGESEAERFLRRRGYKILDRNVRSPLGELDLIAQMEGVLIFVEVKARRTAAHGGAPYAVGVRKQAKLIRLASQYLARRRIRNRICRFDVVLCTGGTDKPEAVEHIVNAFDVPGDDLRW
ncbi:MAG TPA: YraN family protein [Nitrospiraceae bacterium]|jgi:putative endonuclease|nr:YraN family protein [Nitrospiraceae bacterium]